MDPRLEYTNPDCIKWEGTIRPDGYGQVFINGERKLAHRVAWHLEYGEEPSYPEVCIDHLCRNRGCINTDHMELVTIGENTRRGWAHR